MPRLYTVRVPALRERPVHRLSDPGVRAKRRGAATAARLPHKQLSKNRLSSVYRGHAPLNRTAANRTPFFYVAKRVREMLPGVASKNRRGHESARKRVQNRHKQRGVAAGADDRPHA
jgi:hypothetical protein